RKSSASRISSWQRVSATTVAPRGASWISAISPKKSPSESRTGSGWIWTSAHDRGAAAGEPRAQQAGDPPDLLGIERPEQRDTSHHPPGDDEVAALDL